MYTIQYLKQIGRTKALVLKDQLEDENCNIDYLTAEGSIVYSKNCATINHIEQIYIFKEI